MTNNITIEQLASVVRQLADAVEDIQSKLAAGHTPKASGGADGATPRVKSAELEAFAQANPGLIGDDAKGTEPEGFDATTDVFVYDVSGRTDTYNDRNTGLPGYWVQSTRGKRFLVDIMGVPFFLHNPLRAEAYAALNNNS
jgi:hypothetical protein